MLYEFKIGNEQIYKKFRIWIDEYPFVNNDKEFEVDSQIITKREKLCSNKKVVCEVLTPRRVSNYALLGCTYNAIDSDFTNIKIVYSKECDKIYDLALGSQYNNKYVGMEDEFVKGIELGVNNFNNKSMIAKGEYIFDLQVTCEVGSSICIFSEITQLLLDIMHSDTLDEESMLKIIEENF